MKKRQATTAIIVLLVIIAIVMIYIAVNFSSKPDLTGQVISEKTDDIVCNSPYIRVGNNCCLDKNINRICDDDEQKNQETQQQKNQDEDNVEKQPSSYCGDGICQEGENYKSCSSDCPVPFEIEEAEIIGFPWQYPGSKIGYNSFRIRLSEAFDEEGPSLTPLGIWIPIKINSEVEGINVDAKCYERQSSTTTCKLFDNLVISGDTYDGKGACLEDSPEIDSGVWFRSSSAILDTGKEIGREISLASPSDNIKLWFTTHTYKVNDESVNIECEFSLKSDDPSYAKSVKISYEFIDDIQ